MKFFALITKKGLCLHSACVGVNLACNLTIIHFESIDILNSFSFSKSPLGGLAWNCLNIWRDMIMNNSSFVKIVNQV
jgi:hypothetical protein